MNINVSPVSSESKCCYVVEKLLNARTVEARNSQSSSACRRLIVGVVEACLSCRPAVDDDPTAARVAALNSRIGSSEMC